MSDPFAPRIGGILSADIAVPEHEREVRFYSRVLGTGEAPLWREDLMNNLGLPVIGLAERSAEHADLPLQWMPHIQVADVAASVARTLELGGSELMRARADDGTDQWAVLRDPNGAAFGIMPVVPADAIPPMEGGASAGVGARVGRISWVDLTVADTAAACAFYRQVFGWSVRIVEMEDAAERCTDYEMPADDGNPAAGIRHARGANAELPPVWMIQLPVGDLAESLRRVQDEGGTVIRATRGADGRCTYAAVRDPVGACLALVHG